MNFTEQLKQRSNNSCELCKSLENLQAYTVPPKEGETPDECAFLCNTCVEQIENPEKPDSKHWRILGETMWSEVPAVQVLAYRMLHRMKDEGWPMKLLDMLYLDDDTKAWADSLESENEEVSIIHKDSNGNILAQGDNVVLIQDLNVKGGGFTAKRGTVVRNIRLDKDNAACIEGKVDGQHIVILTKFVKKN